MAARWAQNILSNVFDEKCFDEVNIRQNDTPTKRFLQRNGSVDELSFDEVSYIPMLAYGRKSGHVYANLGHVYTNKQKKTRTRIYSYIIILFIYHSFISIF